MYENLDLLVQHHKRDLEREARQARLAHDVISEQRTQKKGRAAFIGLLAQTLHIR